MRGLVQPHAWPLLIPNSTAVAPPPSVNDPHTSNLTFFIRLV